MTTSKSYDFVNRLTAIQSTVNGLTPAQMRHAYAYNNVNQRTRDTWANGSFWDYGYDKLGQVTNGVHRWVCEMCSAMSKTPIWKMLILGLFVAIASLGCRESEKPHVKAAEVKSVAQNNLARSVIGLRLVQDNWVLYRSESDFDDWKATASDDHLSKRVFKGSGGGIVEEEDFIYSGRKFTDSDGTWSEFVTVNYRYESKQVRVLYTGTNQSIKATLAPFENHSDKVKEALAAVEAVVKIW